MKELKASIEDAFRERTPEMVESSLRDMEERLRLVLPQKGGHVDKKYKVIKCFK